MRHGTVSGYNRGCRCDACTDTGRAYYRARNHTRNPKGSALTIDTEHLMWAMESRDLEAKDVAEWAGIDVTTLSAALRYGRCTERTIDRVACALGYHMSEFEMSA